MSTEIRFIRALPLDGEDCVIVVLWFCCTSLGAVANGSSTLTLAIGFPLEEFDDACCDVLVGERDGVTKRYPASDNGLSLFDGSGRRHFGAESVPEAAGQNPESLDVH